MIETFDPGVVNPRSSRKHRRLDDNPSDGGGESHPVGPIPPPSYKESLMKDTELTMHDANEIFDDEDVEILEGDVTRSRVDGIISIDFFDRVRSLAEKSMDQTLVVKLLGRWIGYTTLRTKIYEIWKPLQALRLMDIDNLQPLLNRAAVVVRILDIHPTSDTVICFHCGRYGHVQETCPDLSPTLVRADPAMEQGPVNQSEAL
ncbi:hypothetical protein V6N11_076525 [Hibiscus sabdariffa]|uniref:CCHC-type domain-containing protein n=1 Tax=Hibiscus sabdariffa TaxID=183260 RepID=A0ABR2Q718_9ROSI